MAQPQSYRDFIMRVIKKTLDMKMKVWVEIRRKYSVEEISFRNFEI